MKHTYKKYFFILFVFVYSVSSLYATEPFEKKNILLLHSYHPEMSWVENINKAVLTTLQPKENNSMLYIEYMDTKRYNSPHYIQTLQEFYSKKYHNTKFDLILSADNNAFDFLLKYKESLFGDTPVVFCGVNTLEQHLLLQAKNFTGVVEKFSAKETIETILKLHPKTKEVYIINDFLTTGKASKEELQRELSDYKNKLQLTYNQNLSLKDLKKHIMGLKKDTAILIGSYAADKNQRYISYEELGDYLFTKCSSPIYCLVNCDVISNVIGGKVLSAYTQGQQMAQIALRILQGETADTIPIIYADANRYIFNYNALKKHKIDPQLLPRNSHIINKNFSLYEEYTEVLFKFIIFFITALILALIFLYLSKRKSRSKLEQDTLLISTIRYAPIVVIPLVTAIIIWLFIATTKENYKELREIEKERYTEMKKLEAQREVDRFISYAKERIKLNKDNKSLQEIQDSLLQSATKIRYGKSGYLFIGSMQQGRMLSHPNQSLVDQNFFNGANDDLKGVFLKFEEIVEKEGKGFASYPWLNPSTGVLETKISYVSTLSEFQWYIASGVYLEEIDSYLSKTLRSTSQQDQKSLNIILMFSAVLFFVSILFSVILSITAKNILKRYKKNIIAEVSKAKALEERKKLYKKLAHTDSLTQIHNRHSIMALLREQLQRLELEGNTSLCVIMFDIDYFKDVNDSYGHDVGDQVLQKLSTTVKQSLRQEDSFGRYGGEEFLILLPNTLLETAKEIAQRIRISIQNTPFENANSITISLGVIEVFSDENETQLLKRVDKLLYNSKQNGRNQVSY